MKHVLTLVALVAVATPTAAQTAAPGAVDQTNAGGAATVKSHMQSQGYRDIRELRQAPNGQWVGKATQNGIGRTVTVQPNGTTTPR